MPLFLRFFHSVRPAMMPDRIVCSSPNRRWASEGGAHGEGLNNSQYSRMCDASTPSVLLRPNLVRTKSRIWAGLMMLTTWSASYNQRSLEKRGLIYRTGSFAKGTQEAH